MKPVDADAELGGDIIAWCCEAATGEVLWQREIRGRYPLRLSGCFSDSCAPPAVRDGRRVVFTNASGTVACFDLDGVALWEKPLLSVGRTLPSLSHGKFVFTRQIYPPTEKGEFPHTYKDSHPCELGDRRRAALRAHHPRANLYRCGTATLTRPAGTVDHRGMKNPTLKVVAALTLAACLGLSLNLWSQDAQKREAGRAVIAWQHLALSHPAEKAWNDKELAKQINQLGREGWEMVSVLNFSKDGTTESTIYYFKKPM